MDKTRGCQLTVLKVFLNVLRCVVAWRNIFASAVWAVVKIHVNSFIYCIGLFSEISLMTKRRATFLGIFRRLFLFIFHKRVFESLDEFGFKVSVGVFEFFDASLKLFYLAVGKVHCKIKLVHSFAKIFSSSENYARIFAIEKYTEISEWTVGAMDAFSVIVLFLFPAHCKSKLIKLKYQNTMKRIRQYETSRMRVGGYLYDSENNNFVNSF
jgi:hypothetical protein